MDWEESPEESVFDHPDQDMAICANCEVPVDASKTPDSSMLHLCQRCKNPEAKRDD